jgi:dihydropyrimidine dehydrogenase (NAD+) subunit PreT
MTVVKSIHDIQTGRLSTEKYSKIFCDKKPPLDQLTASVESTRCYFCYDAPCIQACPTEINIPQFIRRISTGNLKGAATEILDANIMGGTCARVCPVESLCEKACVRNTSEDKPVTIGQLQRYATDWLFEKEIQPFTRASSTGKKIAVIGAGPAGLSCAHKLATLGHDVSVFEAKEKGGGLNEYGLAAYKMVDDFAQREIDFILAVGGIKIHYGQALGQKVTLAKLRKDFDAVFLGTGLSGVNELGIEGEELAGVVDAVDYISQIRQAKDPSKLPVARRAVVIGGGNTAVDIAVQSKLLGAEDVTLVYRRGVENMGATWAEQQLAQKNGVLIKTFSKPVKIHGDKNGVTGIEFERTRLDGSGKLVGTGDHYTLACDTVFKAIGQILRSADLGDAPELLQISKGRVVVDEKRHTTLAGVYAGGDCINGGVLTVNSVQDGKIAALAIHEQLLGISAVHSEGATRG